jgi:hypothetical protein
MRSTRLTAALAAAGMVTALAPALALAAPAKHPHHHAAGKSVGSCHIRLNVAPRLIYSGEKVSAAGALSCAGTSAAAQTVTIYSGSLLTPGYSVLGTTTTEANGAYKLEISSPLTASTHFYALADGAQSAIRSVKVAALVALKGPAEGANLPAGVHAGSGSHVTFTGVVDPGDVGAVVVLQRENALTGNGWYRIGAGRVRAGGTFSISHRFLVPGDAAIRVLVQSQARNVASPSNTLNYEISQAQVPGLSINSSLDPINDGQPVVISGTLAGAANTAVTLLAHTVHQHTFAPVAQGKTNSKGVYEFPALAPVNSTLYEVQGDGLTSAVLYQAVKDLVTTVLSPGSSVQVGQTLKFAGNVTPDRTGHVIYLEREGAPGTFHVVEVSVVTTGSAFSIEHTVYEAGTSIFRVRLPGDPQNSGGVSPPFTIVVAPASSASSIAPEAPGNSTLPPEGQL